MLVLTVLLLPIILFLIHHLLFKDGKLPPGPTLWQLWQKRSTFAKKPHLALKELTDYIAFSYFNGFDNAFKEIFIAGIDAPTITIVWLMAELIKNQQILLEVRQEIEMHAVEGGVLNESLLSKCSYLQACIKETLRVHVPSLFGLPRQATKSCKVSNYMILRDSIVAVNSWAIQLDPKVWEDASTFKPLRFLDSGIDYKGSHFEFIPFSSGNRMCPGWNMAVQGVQLVVASLVYYFDWSLLNGANPTDLDMSEKFGTTLKMEKPLYLIPKLREQFVDFEICNI